MGLLGDRPAAFVFENALRGGNYTAMVRALRVYRNPGDVLTRYLFFRGEYPTRIPVRTPTGWVCPTVYSPHDVITVHEKFCRHDYRIPPDAGVIVDVGANIGISALYFLSRGPLARCYLYEPVERNAERLRQNLEGLQDRWRLSQVAVADRAGKLPFFVEASGRYGSLEGGGPTQIDVEVRHISDVLNEVLEAESRVDVLKLDTEGSEAATVRAISSEVLSNIRVILCEDTQGEIEIPGWHRRHRCLTTTLVNPRYACGSP